MCAEHGWVTHGLRPGRFLCIGLAEPRHLAAGSGILRCIGKRATAGSACAPWSAFDVGNAKAIGEDFSKNWNEANVSGVGWAGGRGGVEWRGVAWEGGAGPNVPNAAAGSCGALARRPMAAGVLNLNTSLNQVAGLFFWNSKILTVISTVTF
jgi:hypothetical protein